MADYIGQDRLICHGPLVEGLQVPLKIGGSTLEFKSKNLGYYVLKCINENLYVLHRYKNVKKFSSGKEPTNTYNFHGAMKVHRIIMGQGDSQFFDAILIVIHEGNPLYFKPMRQKVNKWRDAFTYVAKVLSPHPKTSPRTSPRPTPEGAVSPSHSTREHGERRSKPIVQKRWRSLPDDHEEEVPANLLPDVIDVMEEEDMLKEIGSPDESYEEPVSKRRPRQSIYRRGKKGGDYVVAVDISDGAEVQDQTDMRKRDARMSMLEVQVPYHPPLSRQRSRSNEDISKFDQLTIEHKRHISNTVGRYVYSPVARPKVPPIDSGAFRPPPNSLQTRPRPREHIYEPVDDVARDCKQLVSLLQHQQMQERVMVELKKDHIAEGLVFVELDSKIYIATWKKEIALHGNFQERIHIGDQLLQVNEQEATSMAIIQHVITTSSNEMVKLWVKRLPMGKCIHLTKKITQPWGFDVHKNEISKVYVGAQLSDHIDTASKKKWVITELNHQPVKIQSCSKDEVDNTMKMAPTELALVLHPKEFIDKILRKLHKTSIKKKRMTDYIV